jgi:hypothetical protein
MTRAAQFTGNIAALCMLLPEISATIESATRRSLSSGASMPDESSTYSYSSSAPSASSSSYSSVAIS